MISASVIVLSTSAMSAARSGVCVAIRFTGEKQGHEAAAHLGLTRNLAPLCVGLLSLDRFGRYGYTMWRSVLRGPQRLNERTLHGRLAPVVISLDSVHDQVGG